jgi:hypothetical protein
MVVLRPSIANLLAPLPAAQVRIPSVRQTPKEVAEYVRCSPLFGVSGFIRWCESHVKIQDRANKREVPFKMFEGQRRLAPRLVAGQWVLTLKGRQLGVTWDAAAYATWRLMYTSPFIAVCVSQERQYANDVLRRVVWMYNRLDPSLRCRLTKETSEVLRFEADGQESEIRSLVGSDKAARSLTGDLVIFDEASRIPLFEESLAAAIPALEVAQGQCLVLSTSAGPQGGFYDLWQRSYGDEGELLDKEGIGPTGFAPVFLHWAERPGRDEVWYDREARRLALISPVAAKQEYPNTPQEAWEHAAGRVYPLFTRERCVGEIAIPRDAQRFRAIDWGGAASAHVVLWIAHVLGKPGLLISPKCPNTIREMLAYRWDEDHPDRPVKKDDHTCDALRYAVSTFDLTGLVYVYREVYRTDSLRKGMNPLDHLEEIHKLSGWIEAPPNIPERWIPGRDAEFFENTVYDSHGLAGQEIAAIYNEHDLPCHACRRSRVVAKSDERPDNFEREILDGIRLVTMLVDGSRDLEKRVKVDRVHAEAIAIYEKDRRQKPLGHKVSYPLERVLKHKLAKQLLGVK